MKRLIPYSYRNVYNLIINTITSIIDVSFSLLSFSIDAFRTHRRHPHYLRQATERHDLPAREQLHFRHRFQPRIQLRGLSAKPRQIHARPDRAALLPPAVANLERRARLSLTKQLGFVQCIASIP